MFHKIPEFVSLPSQTLTLLPATIISTGASDSGRIKPGDMIELEITKIGKIKNPVITEI
jgi:2-keto-4-pentenoate hydratase/2-oxohepta-3-ene-1,7-dioic acid hydratase in catechol pathway